MCFPKRISVIGCGILIVVSSIALAETPPEDQQMLESVASRLLAVCDPVDGYAWPPIYKISDEDQVQAFATLRGKDDNDRPIPQIVVSSKLMREVIDGNEDRLAFIFGHELSHILLKHVEKSLGDTALTKAHFTQQQELDADLRGMQLLLSAGYSRKAAEKGVLRMMELGLEYSALEGLKADHPNWKDRLGSLDKRQAELWHAMNSFEIGAQLLLLEQYTGAERCFDRVVKEFPKCAEAWANLGYARLMQYCDKLDPTDLRALGIEGQIVTGGFYRRSATLEGLVRGVDDDLWWQAVGALREAIQLDDGLVLAKANLGLAYYLSPAGKDVGRATQFLTQAADALAATPPDDLEPLTYAAVLTNLGVVDLAANRSDDSNRRFQAAREAVKNISSKPTNMLGAVDYNEAARLAGSESLSDQRKARQLLENYLNQGNATSVWWSIAFEKYSALCRNLGDEALTKQELEKAPQQHLRSVTGVVIEAKGSIAVSDDTNEIRKILGDAEIVPVVRNSRLGLLRYPQFGMEILAANRIIAIRLYSSEAVQIEVRETGLGTPKGAARVGMSSDDLEGLLGDDYEYQQVYEKEKNYRYYRSLGLAVRVKGGVVTDLIIVQLPESN